MSKSIIYQKNSQYNIFLEIVKGSDCTNEWLIYDIADALNLPREELLDGKQMQLEILQSLSMETPK